MYYEALSWQADEDLGYVLTHDGVGEPMGFVGCHVLSFGPAVTAKLTTEAAASATGLEVSVSFFDEGLS